MRVTFDVVIKHGTQVGADHIISGLSYSYANWLIDYIRAGHKYTREFKRCTGIYMRPRLVLWKGFEIPSHARYF